MTIILLGGMQAVAQANGDFQTKNTTGNWSNYLSWNIRSGGIWIAAVAGELPTTTSSVYVQSGQTISVDNTAAVCNDLNFSGSGTTLKVVLLANNVLTIYGSLIQTDNTNVPFPSFGAGAKIVFAGAGNQTIANSGISTNLNNVEINKTAGVFTLPGANTSFAKFTLTAGTLTGATTSVLTGVSTSTITVNGGSWTQINGSNRINGGSGISIPLLVNGGTMTLATASASPNGFNFSDVTITNNGILNLNNGTGNTSITSSLNIDGTSTLNYALTTFTAPPTMSFLGTVNYTHTSAQSILNATYGNLGLSGGGNKNPAANLTVNGNITIASPAVLPIGSLTATIGGNWTSYGTAGFTESTSIVDFNGSGAQSVNTTGGEDFFKVRKSGTGTLTLNSDFRLANTSSELNISAGVLDAGTYTLSGTTSTALTMTGGTLKLGKLSTTLPEFDITPGYALSGGTIELNGTGAQVLRGARDYRNLTFSNGGTKTISSGIPNVNGTVYITGGSTILDIGTTTLGGSTTKLTMDDGRFRMSGASLKPDMEDVYSLTGGVIEFYNSGTAGNQTINGEYGAVMPFIPIQYNQIEVTGNKVGNSNTNITLRSGGSFTVKSTGVFEINDESITQSTGGTQTVTVENGGLFKTGDKDGFSGGTGALATSVNSLISNIVLASGSTVEYSRDDIQNITNTLPYSNLTISGTAGIKTAPTGVLTVQGNLVKSGASTFEANGGTVLLNGTNQAFAGLTYNNLRLDNAGTKTLSANATILDSLTIGNITTDPATTLAIGNTVFLTLKSTVSKTARLGTVAPAASIGYSGAGRFVVERHYPPRRAWRLLTAPITNDGNRNVFNSWQMGGAVTSQSGLFVTGPMAPAGGLDVSPLNNYSFKTYDGLNMTGVDNTTITPISGNTGSAGIPDNYGMFVFVRGDRSGSSLFIPPNSNQTTLRDTGKVQIKTQTFNFSGAVGGYSLVGNPFASEVNMNLVMASGSGIDNSTYYAYDPYLSLDQGGYLTYTADFSGAFTSTPPSPGGQKNYLYSSQAFFVKRTASSGSLTFAESNKSGGIALGAFRPQAATQSFSVNLYLRSENDSTVLADGVKTLFDERFVNPENSLKAKKFTNINENLGLVRDSEILAVEGRAPVTESDTVFLNFTHTAQRNYQLRFEAESPDPLMTALLEDNYTGSKTPVNLQSPAVYNFSVVDSGRSAAADRFRIVFKTTDPLPVVFSQVKAWQQTGKIAVEWTVENELNADHYEVEKSTSTSGFTRVNTTSASGNGQPTTVYRWLDPAIAEGNNYYRILYTEKNGKKGYSRTVNVRIGKTITGINIYPNPVKGGVIGLQFNNVPAGLYQARLINTVGQVLFSKIISAGSGSSAQTIEPTLPLDKGIYQLEITHPDKTVTLLKIIN